MSEKEIEEYINWKEVYDALSDDDSISYQAFIEKVKRLKTGSRRTYNTIAKGVGGQPMPKQKKPPPVRDFLAYDGEGFGDKYILLANSNDEHIADRDGLGTKEALEFLSVKYDRPLIRIFFSFGYDVNHIIRDLSDDDVMLLMSNRQVKWEGYTLQYIPGKIFSVNNIKYYDVFSFFQTSFINVVKKMLGEEYLSDVLTSGKAARGSFETWSLDDLIKYNNEELDLLVQVMEKLREAFQNIDVWLRDWYGPGAVAKYWYEMYEVEPRPVGNDEVAVALNRAYYGGRFEQIKLGRIAGVYEYDLHSAYPSVMATMPYFFNWKHTTKYEETKYSIWHVSFDLRGDIIANGRDKHQKVAMGFFPLPMRSKDGRICYPVVGKGWYWQSEIQNAIDFFPHSKIVIHEGWVAETEGRPFGWVKEMYDERQRLKAEGNLSEYAIKVGLNSLYGKTAQRVGRNKYFSLAWAGFITAEVRAKLARVGYQQGREKIIGFATDALFSTAPLDLPLTTELGDWEESIFQSGTFFQSGVYRLETDKGNLDRYRGSPLRSGIDLIVTQLKKYPNKYPEVLIGRFISHVLAIRNPKAYGKYRLQFVKVVYKLQMDAPYKRHYLGFKNSWNRNAEPIYNFRKMLTETIHSLPKIWMGDTMELFWWEYIYGRENFTNIESYPPPAKSSEDTNLQASYNESEGSAVEMYDFPEFEDLPVVEDTLMN